MTRRSPVPSDADGVDFAAALGWLRTDAGRGAGARDLARHLGIVRSALDARILRHFHTTPIRWLEGRRLDWARSSVQDGTPLAQAAHDAGFDSREAFVKRFHRRFLIAPDAYGDLADAEQFGLELPGWLARGPLLAYLGRDPRSASEVVDGQRFRFAMALEGRPLGVTVTLDKRVARAEITPGGRGIGLPSGAAFAVHQTLLRLLGAHLDPGPFERRVARDPGSRALVDGRRGLAISQTRDLFDALLWVVAGQQVSLPVAFALRRRLTRRVGARLDDRLFVPPTTDAVAAMEVADLRRLGFSVRKAEYIQGIARAAVGGDAVGGDLDLRLVGRSAVEVAATLSQVRGLGPWSVGYLLMRAFSFADCVPVGDAVLVRKLAQVYRLDQRPGAAETLRLMAPFAPYRSLATFYLWAMPEG